MDINYLNRMIDLYLKSEKDDKKAKLSLTKLEDTIRFSFGMNDNTAEKTIFMLPFDIVNENIFQFLRKYKDNLIPIEEKYEHDSETDYCYYVKFNNGRIVTFNHFTLTEINNIRNILYNIQINQEEIRIPKEDNKVNYEYLKHYNILPKMGFSSYKILFLSIISITITLCLSLIIFNLLIK